MSVTAYIVTQARNSSYTCWSSADAGACAMGAALARTRQSSGYRPTASRTRITPKKTGSRRVRDDAAAVSSSLEGCHRDATKDASIGGGVVFAKNELPRLFDRFRVVHYEDTEAMGDFGMQKTRVVRLAAEKPQ
jgi:hypothetical protein